MQFLVIFSLVIAIIAVIFAVQNNGTTTLQFLVWKQEIPLAVGLVLAAFLGAMISLFASMPAIFREKMAVRKLRKQVADIETSLQNEQSRLEEAKQKLTEMDTLKTQLDEQEAQLAESQQKIQILQGRLDLEMKKSGRPPINVESSKKPEKGSSDPA